MRVSYNVGVRRNLQHVYHNKVRYALFTCGDISVYWNFWAGFVVLFLRHVNRTRLDDMQQFNEKQQGHKQKPK
jgi:hypothetical protein